MTKNQRHDKRLSWRKRYADHIRYSRTPKGVLVRAHIYLRRRVENASWRYHYGLEVCDRQEFYKAFLHDPEYLALYVGWVAGRYKKKLRPTPDRIDSSKGYTVSNIRWRTYLENVTSALTFGRGTQDTGDLGARL